MLTLILCLAFRKRRYDFYDEDFEEESSEMEQDEGEEISEFVSDPEEDFQLRLF